MTNCYCTDDKFRFPYHPLQQDRNCCGFKPKTPSSIWEGNQAENISLYTMDLDCVTFERKSTAAPESTIRYKTSNNNEIRPTSKAGTDNIATSVTQSHIMVIKVVVNNITINPRSRALLQKSPIVQLLKNFPKMLWNTKFYYRIHKCTPLIPILSHINSRVQHPILCL
jgi:hypothetical protein